MVSASFLAGRSSVIPITEAVTYTPSGGSAITNCTAERRPITKDSPLFGQVSLDTTALEFVLRNGQLSGNTPRQGDTITDSTGAVYRVMTNTVRLAGSRHHCGCVKHL